MRCIITLRDGTVVVNKRAEQLSCALSIPVIYPLPLSPRLKQLKPIPKPADVFTPEQLSEDNKKSLLMSAVKAIVMLDEVDDKDSRKKWLHVKNSSIRSFAKFFCARDISAAYVEVTDALRRWFPDHNTER